MPKSNMSLGRVAVIAGFALSCFGLLLFLWIAFGGSSPLKPKGYRFQASFDDAATLAVQADVRVAGVSVGKVVAKERDPAGNRTLATIQLESDYAPLRSDARAILRQKTLLGETFVELTTGTKATPWLSDNGRLRDARVADGVEFDEFLRVFDRDTRNAFQDWQQNSARATRGLGGSLSGALGNLPGFVGDGASVMEVLGSRREALAQLVRGTGDTFEALTRNEAALQGLITNSRVTFDALAGEREALAESIKIFPTFLRESRVTLRDLGSFSVRTEPLIRDLEPVLQDLQPTVRSLRVLAPDLQRLFAALPAVITAGRTGLPALGDVFEGLRPTLAELGPLLQQLNPIVEMLEVYQATVSDFLSVGAGATAMKVAARPGSNGHALPQLIVLGNETLPATTRDPANRGNAYFPPNGLADPRLVRPETYSLPAWDCTNAGGDKAPDSTPGCFTAGNIPFQGRLTRFPQAREAGSGGVSQTPRSAR